MLDSKRLVKTFIELVEIDSTTFDEKKVADYLIDKLKELGADVRVDSAGEKVGSNTGNVIARLPGDFPTPAILFDSHMDTVEPGVGIKPRVEGGVIRSDGKTILGADDKAGVAAILELLQSLSEQTFPHGDVEVVFTIAEERGLLGSKNLDLTQFKSKLAYVLDGEGPVGRITLKAPSQNSIKVLFKGKAAHAGVCPEKGINAIQAAARAISKMKLGRIDEETTANIGIIRGGLAPNIVPEESFVEGEARSHLLEKLRVQTEHMRQCFLRAGESTGARVDIDVERSFDGFSLDEESEVVKFTTMAMRRVGLRPKFVVSGGGSEANIFNKGDIPAVNLSVGARDVHSTREWITVADLESLVKVLIEMVRMTGNRP
ncbi:MAG: M20/M25/M40 family metallo-hydrolase [Actinomycetota bacterium]|nr:M20/M25/M40 family metallo-hydrolase [Actinomycetota bacterium]